MHILHGRPTLTLTPLFERKEIGATDSSYGPSY